MLLTERRRFTTLWSSVMSVHCTLLYALKVLDSLVRKYKFRLERVNQSVYWVSFTKFQIQIHAIITIFTSVKVYIYFVDDGYKGDPQKALLKTSSMRATICVSNTHLKSA